MIFHLDLTVLTNLPPLRIGFSTTCTVLMLMQAVAAQRDSRAMDVLSSPAFVENVGQAPAATRFVARSRDMVAHFEPHALVLQLLRHDGDRVRAEVVRLEFENARTTSTLTGRDRQTARFHYFTGSDAGAAHTGAHSYAGLTYEGLWEGIDVRIRTADGIIVYDVILAPGADLADVVIRSVGATGLDVEADGRLAVLTQAGPLHQTAPVAWTEGTDGTRTPVTCRFRRLDADRYGFAVPETERGETLVIDPGLEWSAFLGGSSYDYVWRMDRSANGELTVAGGTSSANFPTVAGSYSTSANGLMDAFVSRITADGRTLLWSTYIGGPADDHATGLAVSPSGQPTVVGFTQSATFPTTPGAFQTRNRGGFGECFVVRLDATGSNLVYSTFLGGSAWDYGSSVAVDSAGRATVLGITRSAGFPVTAGAYDTSHNGGGDGFITRLDATGSNLVFSTFLGSSGWDKVNDLTLDDAGNVFVVGDIFGVNNTSNFPTTAGAYDTTFNDQNNKSDTSVSKLSSDGGTLLWSTWLGGNNWDPPYSIVLDRDGNPTIAGETWSPDFPVTGAAYQQTNGGLGDVYVARISADGTNLMFASFLGGAVGEDRAHEIDLDPFDAIVVSGWTESSDFPTTPGAFQRSHLGLADGFVARFSADASELYYSTLISSSRNDHVDAMVLDPRGAAVVAGGTFSNAFPTTAGAFSTTYSGLGDAFVAQLDMLPTGARQFGTWVPACTTATPIGITHQPRANTTGFALLCAGAPPNTAGALLLGFAGRSTGLPLLGADLYLDVANLLSTPFVMSDADGASRYPIPIPANVTGARVFAQYIWLNTATCLGAGTLSSSDAIDLTVQ